MKKIIAVAVMLVLLVTMAFSVTGCQAADKTEIRTVINEFEGACNKLDFDAVLDCINPQIADKVKLALGFVGMFTNTDTSKMDSKTKK